MKLNFVIQLQEQTEWCWAAVTASISNFYAGDASLRQCDVANQVLLRDDCCGDGRSDCNQQFELDSALRRLKHFRKKLAGQPDFSVVAAEIAAGRPLAVGIEWADGGGHAIVVYGVGDDRNVNVADPDHPNDEIVVPFDGFVYKDIGRWSETLFTKKV